MGKSAGGVAAILGAMAVLMCSHAALASDATPRGQIVPCGVDPSQYKAYFRYPVRAQKTRLEGTVVLTVQVAQDGSPERVTIASSSGSGDLDRAARAAARNASFCKLDGKTPADAGLADLRVDYQLDEYMAAR